MTLGIMQPYFLPYMGYFQLMNAVDTFVYYDDVTYIKQGWINRNYILLDGKDYRFTLELKAASSYKNINEIEVGSNREKLYKTFVQAYSKSPYYEECDWLLYDIFHSGEKNLFNYITQVHFKIFKYLEIDTTYLNASSNIKKDCLLKGKDKVINICKILNATTYINAIAGKELYSKDEFLNNGIKLYFLCSAEDLPKRSIIDVLMNYSKEEVKSMINDYVLE
jgi:hypothetical protein